MFESHALSVTFPRMLSVSRLNAQPATAWQVTDDHTEHDAAYCGYDKCHKIHCQTCGQIDHRADVLEAFEEQDVNKVNAIGHATKLQ